MYRGLITMFVLAILIVWHIMASVVYVYKLVLEVLVVIIMMFRLISRFLVCDMCSCKKVIEINKFDMIK